METNFVKYFKVFVVLTSILLIAANLVFGFFTVMAQRQSQGIEQPEPGFQYADLKEKLNGIQIAGFLSDGNETSEGNDGQFMLAQYMLAPTVLDLGNSDHPYNILNCSTPDKAIGIMKIINAKPIHINPFGKILTEKTP